MAPAFGQPSISPDGMLSWESFFLFVGRLKSYSFMQSQGNKYVFKFLLPFAANFTVRAEFWALKREVKRTISGVGFIRCWGSSNLTPSHVVWTVMCMPRERVLRWLITGYPHCRIPLIDRGRNPTNFWASRIWVGF